MPFGGGATNKSLYLHSEGDMAKNVGLWDLAANTNGTLAGYAGQGGGVVASITGADNDLAQVTLNTGKGFKFAAGCRGWVKALLFITNGNTNLDAYFGFTSGADSGTGVFSNTAATLASQDALMFYRLASSAFWRAAHINAAAVDTDEASTFAQATATDYYLHMYFEGRKNGLYAEFWVGDDSDALTKIRTVEDKSYTDYDEMFLSFGTKSTAAASASSVTLKSLTYDINMGTT